MQIKEEHFQKVFLQDDNSKCKCQWMMMEETYNTKAGVHH